jgi:hypothetical protein
MASGPKLVIFGGPGRDAGRHGTGWRSTTGSLLSGPTSCPVLRTAQLTW